MKPLSKRKKIILIVVTLSLISLLIVTEVTGIYYYRSHIRAKTNKSWSGVNITAKAFGMALGRYLRLENEFNSGY